VYDEDLKNLDEGIRRLKIEYDIFFVGNRRKPPEDLRLRVEKLVKRLSEASDMSVSQRFLYNTLIARFYVYKDCWRRTLQQQESAEDGPRRPAPAIPKEQDQAAEEKPLQEIQVSIRDPLAETALVRRLYDELLRMKRGAARDTSGISFTQFAEYIAQRMQGIKKKHQCTSVTFRIALEENSIKFTAKADNRPSS
jgi:hypothetical protein